MTLPMVAALRRQWRRFPPTHRLMAAWIGWKPPEDDGPADEAEPPLRFQSHDEMREWWASGE